MQKRKGGDPLVIKYQFLFGTRYIPAGPIAPVGT
jgi:hypothetical protein